jgi:hypothetical protein
MKVQPEMLLKTHDREHETREYGMRGVQILTSDSCLLASLPLGTQAPVERAAAIRVVPLSLLGNSC